jgi:divalent metal cation (Fe/Co/Zn/Cd) transporter
MAESRQAIYAAIGANCAIAVTKFTAAAFTGSSAMISEGTNRGSFGRNNPKTPPRC